MRVLCHCILKHIDENQAHIQEKQGRNSGSNDNFKAFDPSPTWVKTEGNLKGIGSTKMCWLFPIISVNIL